MAAAEFLITLSRKGEPLRAVAGRRVAGASHRAPRFRGFGVELGFVSFIRGSFVFSARSPRCPAGKGNLSCPGQGLALRGGADRGARGRALGRTALAVRPAARGEAAPAEVCMDLHRPGRECPLCPRLFYFLTPKNSLMDKRRSLLGFNLQN